MRTFTRIGAFILILVLGFACGAMQVSAASENVFPEDYGIERWLDASGQENPSLYWDMTKEYICKFKDGNRT